MAGRPHLETHEARLAHGLFDTPDTSVFLTKRTFFLSKRTFFLTKRTFFLPKRTLFLARGFSLYVGKYSFLMEISSFPVGGSSFLMDVPSFLVGNRSFLPRPARFPPWGGRGAAEGSSLAPGGRRAGIA
ncbi:MAG: hypothetical protein LBP86_03290, partial [Azoarcus sp.]|nr:hypothetical protein [Azoarcus sp.]